MGMTASHVELLIGLRRQGFFGSPRRVVEIGAQQAGNTLLANRSSLAPDLSESFGVDEGSWPLPAPIPATFNSDGGEALSQDAPATRPFWRWLGFDYSAIDVDGSPGAVPLDLNYDGVPPNWRGHFHLATNYGTTEHVCNQLNAFKAIHDLVEPGGVMIHSVPAQGNFCHGLVNYNMKFFWLLARSNEYQWLYRQFIQKNSVDIHPDVIASVSEFDSSILSRRPNAFSNGNITVALQKTRDRAFVAPIDIPNGAKAPTKEIEERYWPVFHPEAADR